MNKLKKSNLFISYLLIIFVLISNIALYLTHKMTMSMFYNSDALYLPSLYKDVISGTGHYSHWFLTPAPYFFPDMPMYAISNFIASDYYYAIPLFFTLQSILFVFAIYKIYSLFFTRTISIEITSFIFAFLYLFPTVSSHFIFLSAFHYGEFLVGLFALYFLLKLLSESKIIWLVLFYFIVLSSLAIASDGLYKLHFLLPFFFSIFTLWLMNILDGKKTIVLSIALAFTIFLGNMIHGVLIFNERAYSPKLLVSQLSKNVEVLQNIFINAYQNETISFSLSVVVIVLAVFLIVFKNKLLYVHEKYMLDIRTLFLSLFLIFLLIGSLSVFSLITLPISTRYMIPLFILPLLFLPIYIQYLSPSAKIKIYLQPLFMILFVVLLILILLDSRSKLLHATIYTKYTTPLVECVDNFSKDTGATLGIAQYWQSKQLYILSNQNLTLAQVNNNLDPYTWITTEEWYHNKYDFALIDNGASTSYKLDQKKIVKLNGAPTSVYHCGKTDIVYYKKGFTLKPFEMVNSTQTWKGAELPSRVGKKIKSIVIATMGTKTGYITFGPYVSLPAGKYSFDINYISKNKNNTIVGSWDVVIALPKEAKLLKKGQLIGTQGNDSHIIKNFTIPEEYSNEKIEIRNFYNGTGDLTIKSLTITRVQ